MGTNPITKNFKILRARMGKKNKIEFIVIEKIKT